MFTGSQSGFAWHRSVYGRIALGVIVLIAVELAVRVSLFLWLVQRDARTN